MFNNLFTGIRIQPACDGSRVHLFFFGKKVFLSNNYPAAFNLDGIFFFSAEQALQYRKAKFFGDDDTANRIVQMQNTCFTDMSLAGLQITISNDENFNKWEAQIKDVMTEILMAKFRDNKEMANLLKSTYPCELVEASPFDQFWSVGLSMNNDKIDCWHNWTGENMLGKILETVRSQL